MSFFFKDRVPDTETEVCQLYVSQKKYVYDFASEMYFCHTHFKHFLKMQMTCQYCELFKKQPSD